MRWLNYQHLYYFWQVAKVGSVTSAAQRLRLAQPTVSAQLKQLEESLGESLFERKGRQLQLTEVGQIAFRYAERIFNLGHEFTELLEGKANKTDLELKIGISDVVPKILAYRLISPALDQPNCSIVCNEDKTERLLADLAIGLIDLVIADRPIPPDVKVKAYNHFIGECGVSFLGAKCYVRSPRLNLTKILADAPLILPTRESALRHELDQWLDRQSISPQRIISFQDRALMKIVAREGRGIVPVPTAIEAEVRREFKLELLGRIKDVKERFYLISTERKLKNPTVLHICTEGQQKVFG